MSSPRKAVLLVLGWTAFVTDLHLGLNTKAFEPSKWRQSGAEQFRVGFLPVT